MPFPLLIPIAAGAIGGALMSPEDRLKGALLGGVTGAAGGAIGGAFKAGTAAGSVGLEGATQAAISQGGTLGAEGVNAGLNAAVGDIAAAGSTPFGPMAAQPGALNYGGELAAASEQLVGQGASAANPAGMSLANPFDTVTAEAFTPALDSSGLNQAMMTEQLDAGTADIVAQATEEGLAPNLMDKAKVKGKKFVKNLAQDPNALQPQQEQQQQAPQVTPVQQQNQPFTAVQRPRFIAQRQPRRTGSRRFT